MREINTRIVALGLLVINVPLLALVNLLTKKNTPKCRGVAKWLMHIGMVSTIASMCVVYGCVIAPYIIKLFNMEVWFMGWMQNATAAVLGAGIGYAIGWNAAKRDEKDNGDPIFKTAVDDDDWVDDIANDFDRDIDCPPTNSDAVDAIDDDDVADTDDSEELSEALPPETDEK